MTKNDGLFLFFTIFNAFNLLFAYKYNNLWLIGFIAFTLGGLIFTWIWQRLLTKQRRNFDRAMQIIERQEKLIDKLNTSHDLLWFELRSYKTNTPDNFIKEIKKPTIQ